MIDDVDASTMIDIHINIKAKTDIHVDISTIININFDKCND